MQQYRLFFFNGGRHIQLAHEFEAENDERAKALIEQMHPEGRCEIWQGQRLVAKLSPQRIRA